MLIVQTVNGESGDLVLLVFPVIDYCMECVTSRQDAVRLAVDSGKVGCGNFLFDG